MPSDGRDVEDGSSVGYIQSLKNDLEAIERAHSGCSALVASGGGRMRVTMDRYEVCEGLKARKYRNLIQGSGWSLFVGCKTLLMPPSFSVLGLNPQGFGGTSEGIDSLRLMWCAD